jgi:hypothetical protein
MMEQVAPTKPTGRRWGAVVATDSVSVNADYDIGRAAVHGASQLRRTRKNKAGGIIAKPQEKSAAGPGYP